MSRIGLFYGKNANTTAEAAKKIRAAMGDVAVELMPIEEAWKEDFETCDSLIVGASTWFDGELPDYWDEVLPLFKTLNLKGKKVAIFGLGDQLNYPDNFVDGMGYLATAFESAGAVLVGDTADEGYDYHQSKAVRNGRFVGLVLDEDNQPALSEERIKGWAEKLKKALI
ncbi:MAG: Flavodoxin [Bacteroidetes bacterium ADurb.Bin416]|nr:MAG: Flavodoxin [Bacteroidetes bacterium ADurb.Bin416]